MLYWGVSAWERSHAVQQRLLDTGQEVDVNKSEPLRTRRAIAAVPILEGIIRQNLGEGQLRKAFDNTLALAEESMSLFQAAANADDIDGRLDYAGFDSELLAQLLDNYPLRSHRVTIPAPLRADDGWYNRDATHDLLTIYQSGHGVVHATPEEIKGRIRGVHELRYRALLLGTKMTAHFDVDDGSVPDRITATRAVYEGDATDKQQMTVRMMESNIRVARNTYEASKRLRRLSPNGSVTMFHDVHRRG